MEIIKMEDKTMNSKQKGNIAVGQALSYFTKEGYYIFLPVSDNGGTIDLIVSKNGKYLQRVQCKYTERRHRSMLLKYPEREIYDFRLTRLKEHYKIGKKHYFGKSYQSNDFDLLFLSCPKGSYMIDWESYCKNHHKQYKHPPLTIAAGKTLEKYKVL